MTGVNTLQSLYNNAGSFKALMVLVKYLCYTHAGMR